MKNYCFWWWNWNISEKDINGNNIEENFISLDYLLEEYWEYFASGGCTFDEYIDDAINGMGGRLYNLHDVYVYFDEKREKCENINEYDRYSMILRKIAHRLWRVEKNASELGI